MIEDARRPRDRIGLLFQVFRTSELTGRLVSRALAPTGIRGDDYAVASYLFQGPMTLTELADGTGLPLTTAAGHVSRFEARGHVRKTRNPRDGRSRLLQLTEAGRREVLDAAAIFGKTVSHLDAVLARDGIDSDELVDQLLGVQDVITAALDELDRPSDRPPD